MDNKPSPKRNKILLGVGSILIALLAVVLSFIVLKDMWSLRGNFLPTFDFESDERHFREIEKTRAEQPAIDKAVEVAPPGASWARFRGPNNDGKSTETALLQSWPGDTLKEVYRWPIGLGFAGFSIADGRAYTIEQRRDNEAVTCYDFDTGHELWAYEYPAKFVEQMGGDGPRATPTIDGDRVYSLGAEGEFVCLDAQTGELIWRTNLLQMKGDSNLEWAMSGAPLIVDDKVIVTSAGHSGDSVHAFDKLSGEPVWNSVPERQAYSSLMEVQLAGRRQLLNLAGAKLNGLDPETGERLWSFPWETANFINCAQPIVVDDRRVFVSSGYGKGCALVEIESTDEGFAAKELWSNTNMKNKFNSSVLVDGYIYGLDEGILACIEALTGKRMWKGKRYGHGQLIYADGNLIVLAEDGRLALVRANPERLNEVSSFQALEGKTWNMPALAGGRLLIRNEKEMVCFDLRAHGA